MKFYFIFTFILLCVIVVNAIPISKQTKVLANSKPKNSHTFSIKGGKALGLITPHVGVVINNLAALNLLTFVTLFPEFVFSKLFGTAVNAQALLGYRALAITIVTFDVMLYKFEDKIGKENALNIYTVSTLARTSLFVLAFAKGVLINPGPIIVGVVLSLLNAYLAL